MKAQPALINADPEVLIVECPATELRNVEFSLEAKGYIVGERKQTAGGWRIEAKRCDCELCAAGRQAQTAAEARKGKPVTPSEGREFFRQIREGLNKA